MTVETEKFYLWGILYIRNYNHYTNSFFRLTCGYTSLYEAIRGARGKTHVFLLRKPTVPRTPNFRMSCVVLPLYCEICERGLEMGGVRVGGKGVAERERERETEGGFHFIILSSVPFRCLIRERTHYHIAAWPLQLCFINTTTSTL
jgi:hypothetical protein